MAQPIYNQIKGALQDAIEITSDALKGNVSGRDYLNPHIEGGIEKWGQDVFNFAKKQREEGEYGKVAPYYVIQDQPELYLRLALGLIKNERDKGRFQQLSDDEFNAFIEELKFDPKLILSPKKTKEFAIKYDKALQKDLARRKEMAEAKIVEDWKKRQLQYRAGIIK
jgi:hypothetical protein